MAIFYTDDEADRKKKKKARVVVEEARLVPKLQPKFIFDNSEQVKQITNTFQLDGTNHLKEDTITDLREVRQIYFGHIVLSCASSCLAHFQDQIISSHLNS